MKDENATQFFSIKKVANALLLSPDIENTTFLNFLS
jgi:hypothetical protein